MPFSPSPPLSASPVEDAIFPVLCSENEGIVAHLLLKKREIADRKPLSENLEATLHKAHRSIAGCKTPIRTLQDLSQIKGVGKWTLRLMKGFFADEATEAPAPDPAGRGRKPKEPKSRRYVPRKNSAAYALLITLYRETANGSGFMWRQELIDATESSGLSRTPIIPDKGTGKPGQFGSSTSDWYSGWSCMKILISKGLVVKSSCPAKYMLTDEGQETARECLVRSGMECSIEHVSATNGSHAYSTSSTFENDMTSSFNQNSRLPLDAPYQSGVVAMSSQHTMQRFQFDISDSDSENDFGMTTVCASSVSSGTTSGIVNIENSSSAAADGDFIIRPCISFNAPQSIPSSINNTEVGINELAMPPHGIGERFEDSYDIALVLDDRENFGSRSRKIHDILNSQFKVAVEIRRLPVGDGIWVARHKRLNSEYVLDFIVERKRVDDLHHSIRDNRYRDQKLRLLRCGLQKLIYLVEGDPNGCEAADSIKTACFTTEILEGFDVQRTTGLMETIKKYGFLTNAISEAYRKQFLIDKGGQGRVCPSFNEFVKKCQDLEKLTISDVLSLQLMQVPGVTEEVALAVVELYPTLISLAQAYALIDGNITAQEEMLQRKSSLIGGRASKNIFKLVWGS